MVLVYVSMLVASVGQQILAFNLWTIAAVLISSGAAFGLLYWDAIVRFVYTFPRDMKAGIALIKSRYFMYKSRNSNVALLFSELAEREASRVACYYKDEVWTFADMDLWTNKLANLFASLGYGPGDEIALVMNSRPEFIGVWLGLAKNGIVSSFINTNQRMETLVHSITACNCKGVLFEVSLSKSIEEAMPLIAEKVPSMEYFSFKGAETVITDPIAQSLTAIKAKSLNELLPSASTLRPANIYRQTMNDKLYYIFTSGTTGLPKAAVIRHHRYIWIGLILRNLFNIAKEDSLYLTLPLYHNNASTLGTSQCITFGTTIVLRDKFSASQYWDDCIKYNCTVGMYIGELCRYLLAQPKKASDTQHNVRLMYGNGLRQEIWADFKNRFAIKQVGEVYGSTEGNANVANYDFTEGACGIIPSCFPPLCKLIFPVTVIKVDPLTGEYVRDRNGLCKLVKAGEIGEIVAKIGGDPGKAYPGYVNNEATKKKIIQNVFRHGDSAFLSGDLVEMDYYGYLYFRDRTGDTFRWKGENVSTNEVEAVIQKVIKLSDCVVFGVNIEHCDGKAGMAVIADPNRTVDFDNLYRELTRRLPVFAIPLFVRITNNIELTGSFKLSKTSLEKEGFDPNRVKDSIYFLDRKAQSYVPMDIAMYDDIQSGKMML